MVKKYLFTSEAVSSGHPDKVCDQISDAILDYFLENDCYARTAIETLVTTNKIVLAGEVKTNFEFSIEQVNQIALNTVKSIGYDQKGFSYKTLHIENLIHSQSDDIAQGVDELNGKEEGAGDQGIMFGYACSETNYFMPAPIYYANKILRYLHTIRESNLSLGLLPDAKSQVTFEYKDGRPTRIHTVLVSHQHMDHLNQSDVKNIILPALKDILPKDLYDVKNCIHHINPTGRFVIGGPDGDTGLTGRKIIVDTYGGKAPHGGGAFSGKDPTKVDRSAAYMARYLAKNIVASGLSTECIIQLSYAIGLSQPLSIYINTMGTGKVDDMEIEKIIKQLVDLSPKGIRKHLLLNNPIYLPTSAYGHFGRDSVDNYFTWEKLDLVDSIKKLL